MFGRVVDNTESTREWMHPEDAQPLPAGDGTLRMIHAAYLQLRFAHQGDYIAHVLREDDSQSLLRFLRWPLERQRSTISTAISVCLVATFACSVAIIACRTWTPVNLEFFGPGSELAGSLAVAALVLAIRGVALRTIQEGLGISKDIERFRTYQIKVAQVHSAFRMMSDPEDRQKLMKRMETVVVDEMREFLRTHHEAKFVL